MNNYKEFAEKIRMYGIQKYGTLGKFAEELGISSPVLSQYLNSKIKPGWEIINKLYETGADLNELFGEKKGDNITFNTNIGDRNNMLEQAMELLKEKDKIIEYYKNISEE